ncbi:hypothetical protein [Sporosarcina sp. FSL K6-1508]|uniref:hypothetical protein n=1 Tax=Sporosarcina sp. FSL K6-1508 TaxID=2921553 RepID=UPI0030F9D877
MEELTINEFLIKNPITDLQDLIVNPSQYIINVEDDYNKLISIITKDQDRYIENGIITIEGGIFIKQHYQEISGVKYWDDLPTLWSYILNVMEEYLVDGQAKIYFPSQPIKIQLKKLYRKKIEFLIDHNRLIIEQDIFYKTFLDRAESFFNILVNKLDLEKYEYEIKQIQKIRLMI